MYLQFWLEQSSGLYWRWYRRLGRCCTNFSPHRLVCELCQTSVQLLCSIAWAANLQISMRPGKLWFVLSFEKSKSRFKALFFEDSIRIFRQIFSYEFYDSRIIWSNDQWWYFIFINNKSISNYPMINSSKKKTQKSCGWHHDNWELESEKSHNICSLILKIVILTPQPNNKFSKP